MNGTEFIYGVITAFIASGGIGIIMSQSKAKKHETTMLLYLTAESLEKRLRAAKEREWISPAERGLCEKTFKAYDAKSGNYCIHELWEEVAKLPPEPQDKRQD